MSDPFAKHTCLCDLFEVSATVLGQSKWLISHPRRITMMMMMTIVVVNDVSDSDDKAYHQPPTSYVLYNLDQTGQTLGDRRKWNFR